MSRMFRNHSLSYLRQTDWDASFGVPHSDGTPKHA